MWLGGDASKSYIISNVRGRVPCLLNRQEERALLLERSRRRRHSDDVAPCRRARILLMRNWWAASTATARGKHGNKAQQHRSEQQRGSTLLWPSNQENAHKRQPTAQEHGVVTPLTRSLHSEVRCCRGDGERRRNNVCGALPRDR